MGAAASGAPIRPHACQLFGILLWMNNGLGYI
jgi:hypothetical protein